MVDRANAVTGSSIDLTIEFRDDANNQLFDPFYVSQVEIYRSGSQIPIQTITGITRLSIGLYKVTANAVTTPGILLDKWTYKLEDGGAVLTSTEATNVVEAPALPTPVSSTIAVPRNSAVVLRPILLTIEFRDDHTGELFDPYAVRQVQILESNGVTVIETITAIVKIGIGKYRIQASAVATPKTILDRWYITADQGEPERTHTQDTVVNNQAALGITTPVVLGAEELFSDRSSQDVDLVLVNEVKRFGITYKDSAGDFAIPEAISLTISDLDGNEVLTDIYLPSADRDPDPPRILNPSIGRYEFPLGLDNGATGANKTDCISDYLFTWKASSLAAVKATATIDPSVATDDIIVWASVASGTPGNFISITYVDPAAPSQTLSVTRTTHSVVVTLATDAFSVITTTANDVIAATTASTTVSEIVTATLPPAGVGTGLLAAQVETFLTSGIDASTELLVTYSVKVISHRIMSLIPKLRLQIDKAVKLVDAADRENPCFLGYTDGQLVNYLESGISIINAYQPSVQFDVTTFPYGGFEFILIETAMMAGVMSQQLFAVDTDIPSWSDQGNAFVIQHQPQLAAYLNWLSARLDKMIPMFKLNFVTSGSMHIEAGANFRLTTLMNAAPSGSLFRNVLFKG